MNRMIATVCLFSFLGCTITVKPLPTTKPRTYHKRSKSAHKPTISIVDQKWLDQYKKLESEHGDYKISDDSKIEVMDNGKYRVTHSMLEHFKDLTVSPVPSPSETPK